MLRRISKKVAVLKKYTNLPSAIVRKRTVSKIVVTAIINRKKLALKIKMVKRIIVAAARMGRKLLIIILINKLKTVVLAVKLMK